MGSDQTIQGLLVKASALAQSGKISDAESICREALKSHPQNCEALCLLGSLVWEQGDVAAALQWFLKALKANPQSARAHCDVGTALTSLNRFDEAVAFLRRAIEFQPHFPEAHLRLGELFFRWAHLTEASRSLHEAFTQNPELRAARERLNLITLEDEQLKTLVKRVRSGAPPDPFAPNLPLPRRELFAHLLNHLELTGAGVEIGVQKGNFSELLLRAWQGRVLYLVDPWREFPSEKYADVSNVTQKQHDEFYRTVIQRLMPFQDRSVIWRMTSKEAAGLIRNEALDFCYLDGDHSQPGVQGDIALWYPKLRRGGILGGHDYIPDGAYPIGVFGVKSAVHEFVETSRLGLFTSAEPVSQFPSWFVVKP